MMAVAPPLGEMYTTTLLSRLIEEEGTWRRQLWECSHLRAIN